jgi:hypothetical protein
MQDAAHRRPVCCLARRAGGIGDAVTPSYHLVPWVQLQGLSPGQSRLCLQASSAAAVVGGVAAPGPVLTVGTCNASAAEQVIDKQYCDGGCGSIPAAHTILPKMARRAPTQSYKLTTLQSYSLTILQSYNLTEDGPAGPDTRWLTQGVSCG